MSPSIGNFSTFSLTLSCSRPAMAKLCPSPSSTAVEARRLLSLPASAMGV
jgi:hypothetical protein